MTEAITPQPLITVWDMQRSVAFYSALLDAQPDHDPEESLAAHGEWFYERLMKDGKLILQLHTFGADENHDSLGDADLPPGNGVVLWFKTGDFAAALDRILQHGMELDREPFENTFARQMEAWLHDPDGYQVVIAGPSAYDG